MTEDSQNCSVESGGSDSGTWYCIICSFTTSGDIDELTEHSHIHPLTTNEEHSSDADDEWYWSKEDLDTKPGRSPDNVAAYRCTRCGTVIPQQFATEIVESDLPEQIKGLCGTVWGGCMDEWDDDPDVDGNVEMELVSDGFINWGRS